MRAMHWVKEAFKLDIFDLNYTFGSETYRMLELFPADALPRRGLHMRLAAFFFRFLQSIAIRLLEFGSFRPLPKGYAMFFAATKNQFDSLAPILRLTDGCYSAGGDIHNKLGTQVRYPFWFAYSLSLPFLPLVIYRFVRASRYQQKSYAYNAHHYWLTYGCYLATHFWLWRLQPSVVVLSNDHNMLNRVLTKAARARRIPVIYVQHASVTNKFPPLRFDIALLEGYDALEKYEASGPSDTTVYLVGMPKVDAYHKCLNQHSNVRVVAICTNTLDPVKRVEDLLQWLQGCQTELSLVLRPHPKDKRLALWRGLAEQHHIGFSDPHEELSFDLLRRVDAIVAGDSNIHLEAALLDVVPILYAFGERSLDWYGFRENQLVMSADSPEDLERILNELHARKTQVRHKTRYYCATVETHYDGHSAALAANVVNCIALGKQPEGGMWSQISGATIRAYELAVETPGAANITRASDTCRG